MTWWFQRCIFEMDFFGVAVSVSWLPSLDCKYCNIRKIGSWMFGSVLEVNKRNWILITKSIPLFKLHTSRFSMEITCYLIHFLTSQWVYFLKMSRCWDKINLLGMFWIYSKQMEGWKACDLQKVLGTLGLCFWHHPWYLGAGLLFIFLFDQGFLRSPKIIFKVMWTKT